jgi:hypothetical protein
MALTLAALINSVSVDCASINFSDTTANYGTSGNPNYSDVISVKWELYDSSFTTLLGTFSNSGWTPYPNNDITFYPGEFGLASFDNGTYGIKYTITYSDGAGGTADLSDNTPTFVVQCGASFCNTTLNHTVLSDMSAVSYPTTITNIQINTHAHTTSISVSSLSDAATKLSAYIAALTNPNREERYAVFIVNGTTLEIENPYYSGLSGNSITIASTEYAGASNGTTNEQVKQLMTATYSCTTLTTTFTDESGLWTGTTFPMFADIDDTVDMALYQVGNSTPLETKTLTEEEFESYILGNALYSDWFTTTLTPCVEYSVKPIILLANGDTIQCYNKYFQTSFCGAKRESGLIASLSQQVTSDCSKMVLCDTTGIYNATYNPNGYGAPNPTLEEIVKTTFEITLLDGSVRLIESGFTPSEYGNNCVDFSITDIFGSDTSYTQIPVGVYQCTYRVYGECDELLAETSINIFFACGLKACLDARAVETCGCTNCDNTEVQNLLLDYADYIRLQAVSQVKSSCANVDLQKAYQNCIVKCSTCNA